MEEGDGAYISKARVRIQKVQTHGRAWQGQAKPTKQLPQRKRGPLALVWGTCPT